MITNLLATIVVTLVTNVTTSDNGYTPNPGDIRLVGFEVVPATATPATKRYETTSITERRALQFSFEGVHREVWLSSRQTSVTKVYQLKHEWSQSEVRTNAPVDSYPDCDPRTQLEAVRKYFPKATGVLGFPDFKFSPERKNP